MSSHLFYERKTREQGLIFVCQSESDLQIVDKQITLFLQMVSQLRNQNYRLRIPFMVLL